MLPISDEALLFQGRCKLPKRLFDTPAVQIQQQEGLCTKRESFVLLFFW